MLISNGLTNVDRVYSVNLGSDYVTSHVHNYGSDNDVIEAVHKLLKASGVGGGYE